MIPVRGYTKTPLVINTCYKILKNLQVIGRGGSKFNANIRDAYSQRLPIKYL